LSDKDVFKVWKVFIKYDKSNEGYINLDDLYRLLEERPNSIVAPYLERLYELIEKRKPD